MTQQELEVLCREWQKRLGLGHWNITIKYKRRDEMEVQGCGCCFWTFRIETATIQILDPVDYYGFDVEFDIEETVVHELLHILFIASMPKDGTTKFDLFEQSIDRMARVLVALKRQNKIPA